MLINIKFKTILKILFVVFFLLALLLTLRLYSDTITMTNENFTQILKDCHENPYKYDGKKIKTSGYIFRLNNFKSNQIVIARDMWINENNSHIVGFLCETDQAATLKDNDWVLAEGTIYVGNYYGPMPIIKIEKIEFIEKPNIELVLPPANLNYSL